MGCAQEAQSCLGKGKKMPPPSLRAFLSRDQFFSLLAEASCLSLLSSQKGAGLCSFSTRLLDP